MQMNLFNPPTRYHYLSTANIYEQEWNEAMMKLANSRHRLTVEDENAIKKIANKL